MGQNLRNVLQEFDDLTKFFADLKEVMFQSINDLEEFDIPPSLPFIEYLATSRRQFEELRATVLQISAHYGVSTPNTEQISSLTELKFLLEKVIQAERQTAEYEKNRTCALDILDRVLAIVPRNQEDFLPLQECQLQASKLRGLILDSQWPYLHPDTERLAKHEHPFGALLTIVERASSTDYSSYRHLQKVLAESFPNFGEELSVAALMGAFFITPSLIVKNTSTLVTTIDTHNSIPQIQLALGEELPIVDVAETIDVDEFLNEITFEVSPEPTTAPIINSEIIEAFADREQQITNITADELSESSSKPDKNNFQYMLQINRHKKKVSLKFIDS